MKVTKRVEHSWFIDGTKRAVVTQTDQGTVLLHWYPVERYGEPVQAHCVDFADAENRINALIKIEQDYNEAQAALRQSQKDLAKQVAGGNFQ